MTPSYRPEQLKDKWTVSPAGGRHRGDGCGGGVTGSAPTVVPEMPRSHPRGKVRKQ